MVLQDHGDGAGRCSTTLTALDRWPEKVRIMQQNWIGRSEGLLIRWPLDRPPRLPARPSSRSTPPGPTPFSAPRSWRSRPTIRWPRAAADGEPGAGALHRGGAQHGHSVAALETAEKKGFDTGIRVVHPFDPSWTLPVYVANFVLMDYGTGRDLRLPVAHDQRDLDFASKYGLPVIPVVMPARRRPGDASRSSTRPMSTTA